MGRFLLIVGLSLGGLGGMGGCGGCGDDSKAGHLPDAPPPPPPDVAIDAPIDAAPLPVKLTITRNSAPAQEVRVYFQNADSSLVKSVKTDAMGTAEAVMDAGGSVTALDPFTTVLPAITGATGDQLRTFVGVKPGDQLFLTLNDDTSESVNIDLTVPSADNADHYDVNTTCGAGTINPPAIAAVSGSVAVHCATADVLVVAQGVDGPLGAFLRADVDLTPQGGVDFSEAAYAGPINVTFHYTHVPSGTTDVSASHFLVSGRGVFVDSYGGLVPISDASHDGSQSFAEPDFAPAVPVLGIVDSSIGRGAQHNIITWGSNRSQYDIDLAGLPRDISSAAGYVQSSQQVQWTEADGGGTPDLSLAKIFVQRPEVRTWDWVIVAPYTRGTLQLPTVPNDGFDFMPASGDTVEVTDLVNARINFVNPGGTGYDAVRGHILDIHERGSITSFATGAAGQVMLVAPPTIDRGGVRASSKGGKASPMLSSGHLPGARR